ncbi:MAG: hypothetical protein H6Q17_1710 [Bacteroidetes bacterium]|nr:hypothetical protein [Bacteroidota bacterium]
MKWFAILFSVYLLGLSLYPCQDAVSGGSKHQSEVVQGTPLHTDCMDQCSPFCNCQCCSTPVLGFVPSIQPHYWTLALGELLPKYISQYYSSLFSSVWQPPELA